MFALGKKSVKVSIVAAVFVLVGIVSVPHHAAAQYVEGNLVDDSVFLDAASMDQTQIQAFLNARGGYLAGYYSWSDRDGASVSAARIIMDAAYDYGLNPKVILATLQKEQSLVTAKNPVDSQLNFAMGYGCPDSTGCGAAYKGFYRQVDNGTWQLRYNFERARGNNSWWRVSSSYPCSGSTRYYSPGLYKGNTVTFYDEAGYGYKTFKLLGAASASLYCYTPHAYPGSGGYYYSGSYNFVTAFEAWFGSTQPTVVVSSPLRVTAIRQGLYTKTPVTVSFDLTNNMNYDMGVGKMAVSVRDAQGNNLDYGLQQMTVPAFSTIHYTGTQVFDNPGNYTFSIVQRSESNVWSENYPVSSNIDNPRLVAQPMLPMPLVTVAPASNVADMRQGKGSTLSFTVKNTSTSQTVDAGKMALAIRGPGNTNYDRALKPVSMAANGTYVYSDTFTPTIEGQYRAYVVATTDSGQTWSEGDYPVSSPGISQQMVFNVKQSPTLNQGLTLNTPTPRAGQGFALSFKLKNFGDQSVDVGKMALAIRDPLGRNVDPSASVVTVGANSEYTVQKNLTFTTPGTYTAFITGTRDNVHWYDDSYPISETGNEPRKITFTVLPSPTLTAGPTITTTDPRVGKAATATFTLHNYGDADVDLGKMAVSARDPKGKNVDFELKSVVVPAGGNYVYTSTNSGTIFQEPGVYSMVIVRTQNNGQSWDDSSYAALENNTIQRSGAFTVKQSPTITEGISMTVSSPHVGQQTTITYKIKNYSDQSIDLGKMALAIRDPLGRNVDPAPVAVVIAANTEYTFQVTNVSFSMAGKYTAFITGTKDNSRWYDDSYPVSEDGSIVRTLTFTVQP